jgi:hypothetical protein
MQLVYKGYLIRNLNYSLIKNPESDNRESSLKVKKALTAITPSSKKNSESRIVRINIDSEVESYVLKNKPFQILNLVVDFIFELKVGSASKINQKELEKLIKDYGLGVVMVNLEDLIKKITSLDYGTPVIVNDFGFPNNVSLTKVKNADSSVENKNN